MLGNGVTLDEKISIHAPRVGSDDKVLCQKCKDLPISIHAPRVGSDTER